MQLILVIGPDCGNVAVYILFFLKEQESRIGLLGVEGGRRDIQEASSHVGGGGGQPTHNPQSPPVYIFFGLLYTLDAAAE